MRTALLGGTFLSRIGRASVTVAAHAGAFTDARRARMQHPQVHLRQASAFYWRVRCGEGVPAMTLTARSESLPGATRSRAARGVGAAGPRHGRCVKVRVSMEDTMHLRNLMAVVALLGGAGAAVAQVGTGAGTSGGTSGGAGTTSPGMPSGTSPGASTLPGGTGSSATGSQAGQGGRTTRNPTDATRPGASPSDGSNYGSATRTPGMPSTTPGTTPGTRPGTTPGATPGTHPGVRPGDGRTDTNTGMPPGIGSTPGVGTTPGGTPGTTAPGMGTPGTGATGTGAAGGGAAGGGGAR